MNYSEEEVRQWREARKKNFPSTANVQRVGCPSTPLLHKNTRFSILTVVSLPCSQKQEKIHGDSEGLNEDAKLCRQVNDSSSDPLLAAPDIPIWGLFA